MREDGWIPIDVIASFNRIRQLTGGATSDHAIALVKDVLQLSSLVEVDDQRDEVRLNEGRWRDFVLPLPAPQSVEPTEGDDTEDSDVEFVIGKDGSPTKRHWAIREQVVGL
jgi:la-related protein 1